MADPGRPSEYHKVKDRLEEITDMAAKGWTRSEIAKELKINRSTLQRYMNEHQELKDALKTGDDEVVENLEGALYRAAMEGNIAAIIFALKNKAPNKWREKIHQELSGSVGLPGMIKAARENSEHSGNGNVADGG